MPSTSFLGSVLLLAAALSTGCSTTSVYKKAARIGLELVGDAVVEDKVHAEASHLVGGSAADADRRYGQPRSAFLDAMSGREIRVYGVRDDLLGQKRWLVELQGGRVDALSQAQINPDLGKDQAKSLLLEEQLRGKTPEQVRATAVADRLIFHSSPRELKRMPAGELVQVYNVTSFLDVTGSRYIVLGYDDARRCRDVRFVGTP